MRRATLALLLSLLLLALQQLAVVHALEHVGARQPEGLTSPEDTPQGCPTCESLASGVDGIASHALTALATALPPCSVPARFTSRAIAAPAVYASRAPPVIS